MFIWFFNIYRYGPFHLFIVLPLFGQLYLLCFCIKKRIWLYCSKPFCQRLCFSSIKFGNLIFSLFFLYNFVSINNTNNTVTILINIFMFRRHIFLYELLEVPLISFEATTFFSLLFAWVESIPNGRLKLKHYKFLLTSRNVRIQFHRNFV